MNHSKKLVIMRVIFMSIISCIITYTVVYGAQLIEHRRYVEMLESRPVFTADGTSDTSINMNSEIELKVELSKAYLSSGYTNIITSESSTNMANSIPTARAVIANDSIDTTIEDISFIELNAKREEIKQQQIETERQRRAEEEKRKAAEEARKKAEEAQKLKDSQQGVIKDVPDVASNFKAYMDYRCITATGSPQYKLQHDGNAETNSEGFRLYNGEYMVAMGSYYSTTIGTRFRITLDSGKQFYAVLGDQKSDAHTDPLHQHRNGNIVEFIVDQSAIPSICSQMGDMSYAPQAGLIGKVKSIEVLGTV